jgi:hypothetical protein
VEVDKGSETPNKSTVRNMEGHRQNRFFVIEERFKKENDQPKNRSRADYAIFEAVWLRLLIAVSYPNLVCFISSPRSMLISLCAAERYNWFKSNEGLLCHNPHRDIYGIMRDDSRRSLADYVKPCKKNRTDQNRSLRFQRAPLNRLIQCAVVDGLQHLDLALDQVHSARPRRSAVRR